MHHLIPIDQLITLVMKESKMARMVRGDKLTSTGWTIRLFSFLPAPG